MERGIVSRPTIAEVQEILRRYRALVVHFSTLPRLDRQVFFPEDLRYVINNPNLPGGICCSVVKPGDTKENTFGEVGLILDFSTSESLIAVSRADGGATLGAGGVRDFDPRYKHFDLAAVEASIATRVGHNEWGVKDFIVRGLFVMASIVTVSAPQDRLRKFSLTELFNLFAGQPLYSFGDNAIVELRPDVEPIRVDHAEIYRTPLDLE
jgi:hypothetical protein